MAHLVYPGHTLVKDLGQGTFGDAKLFRNDATGELVAVKWMERNQIAGALEKGVKRVEREILNHRHISGHPNIVALRQVFLTPTHLGIAMEYAAGGELFATVLQAGGRLPEDVARYFFQQLVSGVAWCHSWGVCHRDLKLENTLLDRPVPQEALGSLEALQRLAPRLKICDFGFSKAEGADSLPKSLAGTIAYIAPEVLKGGSAYDGKVADVWSCGVLLFVMLVGAYPFADPRDPNNHMKMWHRIQGVHYSIPDQLQLSHECRDLLSRIFTLDPCQRPSLAAIRQHPWFLQQLPQGLQFAQLREEIAAIVEQLRQDALREQARREAEAAEASSEESEAESDDDGAGGYCGGGPGGGSRGGAGISFSDNLDNLLDLMQLEHQACGG